MEELQDLCMEMLHRYQREEAGYNVAFINAVLRDFDTWQFETKQGSDSKKPTRNTVKREWEDW